MEQKNQITEGVIWKQLLIFFFPIVIGTFFQQVYNTADSIVVGRFVGKEALAAVSGSVNRYRSHSGIDWLLDHRKSSYSDEDTFRVDG